MTWTNDMLVLIVSTNRKTALIVSTNRKTVLIVSTSEKSVLIVSTNKKVGWDDLAGGGVHDPDLVGVRGDDGAVSLQGDGQGEEHAGGGGQVADSVTQGNQNTEEREQRLSN